MDGPFSLIMEYVTNYTTSCWGFFFFGFSSHQILQRIKNYIFLLFTEFMFCTHWFYFFISIFFSITCDRMTHLYFLLLGWVDNTFFYVSAQYQCFEITSSNKNLEFFLDAMVIDAISELKMNSHSLRIVDQLFWQIHKNK